ncbi:MAG: GGDEF domain-containing protein [Syntrophobacteraceae bacterium]|nr:GGDEF domain-containing protein [Syntrophobacteraceae bacterium]
MTRANSNEKPQMLDALCELVIDELKSFSSSRQTISSANLLQAFSEKADVFYTLSSSDHVSELKSRYGIILEGLSAHFTGVNRQRAEELLETAREAQSLGGLYDLLERIVELVSKSLLDSEVREKTLSRLLIEVGSQLVEVEKECLGLIETTTNGYRENTQFTDLLESEITQLESSAESSESVQEVREVLRGRLQTIKSALETKKAEDTARKETFESTIEKLQNSLTDMQSKIERDRKKRKRIEQEAHLDPLTGIANRRVIDRHIRKEIKRYKQDKTLFSVIFIDIDDFKTINDTYGHRVGDKCLKILAVRMKEVLRQNDLIARYGGDEFVVFLGDTGQKTARVVADKLSQAISKTCFVYKEAEIQLSVSIGLTQVEEGDTKPEEIVERADSALYDAKNRGKDCIMVT